MARASTHTLLSLDRYAEIMQVSPLFFSGAVSSVIFPLTESCGSVWYQYNWQHAGQTSREELAGKIASAEEEIARYLGYWPAPKWIVNEVHPYPQFYRRDVVRRNMTDIRGQFPSIRLNWGKFIQGGQRVSTHIEDVAVSRVDSDLDGYEETVNITATVTTTDACEIGVYFAGHNGDPEWEIRPARSKSISAGVFTASFYSWQFLDPGLSNAFPTTDFSAIDADDDDSYVDTVEVRRTHNDYTESHGLLYWENRPSVGIGCSVCGGVGCSACAFTTQDLCIHVRETDLGVAVVTPATYDSDDGRWEETAMVVPRDPDQVSLNYYAGEQSREFLSSFSCDPLPHFLAEAIAWLATARLERSICDCGPTTAFFEEMRRDMSITSSGDISRFIPDSVISCPFGTRVGEVKAWRRIDLRLDSVNLGVAV